jgi:glycosyltransferase involved in cell wall biosynthesis
MRIFCVFFHPSLAFTALGGAEKRLIRVLRYWESQQVNVTVIDANPGLVFAEHGKCEVFGIPSPIRAFGKGLFSIYLEWVLWVLKACFLCPPLIKRTRHDCILAPNNNLPTLIVTYLLHCIFKVPLCVVVHHLDFPYVDKEANFLSVYTLYREAQFSKLASSVKAVVFFLMLWLLRRSDCCIAVSKYTASVLVRNHVPQSRVKTSGNGVDIDFIESVKASGKQFDGVFVGRIARDKGIFDLVRVWKRISLDRPDSALLMLGSGPDFSELAKVIKDFGMASNIVLKGSCKDIALYNLMKASRLLVLPSRFEGWGLAVGEALACGLPVVCYDIPALREVFGECRSVFFVPVGDIVKFAETVKVILEDGDLCELGKIGKEYVRRFSWRAIASRDMQILKTLVHVNGLKSDLCMTDPNLPICIM